MSLVEGLSEARNGLHRCDKPVLIISWGTFDDFGYMTAGLSEPTLGVEPS